MATLAASACAAPQRAAAPFPNTEFGGAALAQACAGRDGWGDPAPPARIFANVHYVGTCGITVLLVTSPAGHVLIDGAVATAAPQIVANIRRLGFDPRDVKYIVGSHEHVDHAGGFAALKAATGAQLVARAPARAVLESGRVDPADPQAGIIDGFDAVPVDRVIAAGEQLRVGPLVLTVHATTGHTDGSTSWTWRSCEASRLCRNVAFVDSLTSPAREGYRFSDHPERVAPFRTTFGTVAALPCDVLLTPHPAASNLFPRLSGQAPLADADACRTYADGARRRLDERLAGEARN